MSKYKAFDQKLFEENDRAARNAVLNYIDSQGLYAMENDDKYGPDLVLYSGLSPISYIEVEVKRVWHGPDFPWDSVQLPQRKEKFSKLKMGTEFYILNLTMDHAIIIPDSALSKDLLQEVRNKYIPEGEMFFQVPIDMCNIVKIR